MAVGKNIVDEVSGWLRVFDDGTVDRTWAGPPEVKFMTESVPPHENFVDGVGTRDVIIDKERNARIRIYLPETNNQDKLPIILHFHGGGFCISQADWYMYYHVYSRLARVAKAIIVSVYLRLAPENRLPAACEDSLFSLLWLQALAKSQTRTNTDASWLLDYGDFNRVFLIGDSSGGNLVHEVAAKAGGMDLGPLKLAGAIPIHPGVVRSERSKSELEQPQSPMLTVDMVDKFLKLALPVGATKDHPITCPMGSQAPPISSLNLPRVLLCVAENDLIKDTNMEYYEELKKADNKVDLLISNGMGHSFYLNAMAVDLDTKTAAETEKLIVGIADFVNKLDK